MTKIDREKFGPPGGPPWILYGSGEVVQVFADPYLAWGRESQRCEAKDEANEYNGRPLSRNWYLEAIMNDPSRKVAKRE